MRMKVACTLMPLCTDPVRRSYVCNKAVGQQRVKCRCQLTFGIGVECRCVCGTQVNRRGTHGLSYRQSTSGGRVTCHHAANESIRRALVSGGAPSVLEPVGGCKEDAKRPDGMTSSHGNVVLSTVGFHML